MFSKLKSFVDRHKKKFIVTGAVVLVGGLALRHVKKRIEDYQEKQLREFLERTRRLQHFEATEKTCNMAIFGLLPGLCENIIKSLDSEAILTELRQNKNSSDRKLELWEELKILSFTRCCLFVYSIPLLVAAMRVQLNVIGGYLYKDTVNSESKITKEIQTMYNLIVIQHLTNVGLQNLIKTIKKNVTKILENVSLKQEMNQNEIEQLFWSIQSSIDKDINHNYVQFVLPTESQFRNQYDGILNKMLSDTIDICECGEFIEIVDSIIVNGFSVVTDKISEYFINIAEHSENSENNDKNISVKKIAVAKLIPIINSLTTQVIAPNFSENQSTKNLAASLTSMYIVNTKLQTLGANVYEVYCQ